MHKVFMSYSHKDEELRNELGSHLAALRRQGLISDWYDREILPGEVLDEKISDKLLEADIVVLLVSADFIASNYCYEREMSVALQRHKDNEAVVIPIILRDVDWHSTPLGKLNALPTDGKPVMMHGNQDAAFADVARGIRRLVEQKFGSSPDATVKASAPVKPDEIRFDQPRSANLAIKKTFTDHEKDSFTKDSFEYIFRLFAGSLAELGKRYSEITSSIEQIDSRTFVAIIYRSGQKVSFCQIWYGKGSFATREISYSETPSSMGNSVNDSLSVVDDGHTLRLKALMSGFGGPQAEDEMTQQGAAEYLWSRFIAKLQ
ncbi:toll/interleukin-1 receptor domain-containing protein [Pseudidiomarina piscicola]|nr:toll/interleukin-1 receptor domain-containing protein [Pseudidiomarina piscicola]